MKDTIQQTKQREEKKVTHTSKQCNFAIHTKFFQKTKNFVFIKISLMKISLPTWNEPCLNPFNAHRIYQASKNRNSLKYKKGNQKVI